MAGYIEDRWYKKGPPRPDDESRRPTRVETDLHGKCKRYRVCGIPGVRKRSFDRKADAEAWKAKVQADLMRGEFVDHRDGNITLAEYVSAEYWPTKTGDPGTLQTIETRINKRILPYLGEQRLNSIKVPQLRKYLADLDERYQPATIIESWGTLSSILQAAVDDEKIPRNPCLAKTVRPPSKPERKARAWSRERVMAVRAGLDDRFKVMVDLGVGAGLRQGEVLGLSVDDIEQDLIYVRRQVRIVRNRLVYSLPKGGKTRTVPLPKHLAERIADHISQFPPVEAELPWTNPAPPENDKQAAERAPQTHLLLVTGEQGRGALRRSVFNEGPWKRALVAAGVIPPPAPRKPLPSRPDGSRSRPNTKHAAAPDDGFHALRHTFASVQLDARESIVSVSKWLGHSDPSITLKIYAHMMPEADGRGRSAMDAWFAGVS
ncbi:tyrosine-type recombinase/integrase [Streptomyces griseofuscus]|uniref:Site-specific integrase n=1 Tax=Streptomyces griseofuscus TaxID=146922 RepID=A0A426RZ71_9ACTN|nr:site-specific integrase [Streptomyces griseofuscus]RRQ81502.1 site-specific integrase [Streptomyces griseofuscus]